MKKKTILCVLFLFLARNRETCLFSCSLVSTTIAHSTNSLSFVLFTFSLFLSIFIHNFVRSFVSLLPWRKWWVFMWVEEEKKTRILFYQRINVAKLFVVQQTRSERVLNDSFNSEYKKKLFFLRKSRTSNWIIPPASSTSEIVKSGLIESPGDCE